VAIHFAFVDGGLGYDCVRCGARCCHGLGFALPAAGLPGLLEAAPGLSPLVQLRERGAFVMTSADGCFALAEDKRCSIELQAGYAQKPLVCRLFPLRPRRVGGTLVVDLQLLSCPMQPADQLVPGPGVARITHAQAERELAGLHEDPLFDVVAPPRGAPDDLWLREAAARELVTAALLTSADAPTALGIGEAEEALGARWRRDLSVDGGAAFAPWRQLFLLCWPVLRLNTLLMPGAPPYPRLIRRLPALAAAGLVLIELAVSLPWPLGRGPRPTPRALVELWLLQVRHRDLLLCWDERVQLRGRISAETPPSVARANAELERQAETLPLGAAFAAAAQGLAASERALLLRAAADRFIA
jgi:hypothetical protein